MSVRSPAISSTVPQGSWPVMIGSVSLPPNGPCQRCTSVPHNVDAVIFISNDPGSRLGICTCSMVNGLLCSVITAARQVVMVLLRKWFFFVHVCRLTPQVQIHGGSL